MNQKVDTSVAIIIAAIIIAVAGLVGCHMYLQNSRFSVAVAERSAYAIDKKTGEAWVFYGDTRIKVKTKTPSN